MNIECNEFIPGYDKETFSAFIATMTKDWNLPPEFISNAESYFLRHWTAPKIYEILTCDGIERDGITFLPLFSRQAQKSYNAELTNPGSEPKYFWLSFRAVRYPLGTTHKHEGIAANLKAYVLIQPDLSGEKK